MCFGRRLVVCRGQNLTLRQSGTQDNIVHITHTCKDSSVNIVHTSVDGRRCMCTLSSHSRIRPRSKPCSSISRRLLMVALALSCADLSRERSIGFFVWGIAAWRESQLPRGSPVVRSPRRLWRQRERREPRVCFSPHAASLL